MLERELGTELCSLKKLEKSDSNEDAANIYVIRAVIMEIKYQTLLFVQ
jgi:hypothetical protein